MFMALDFLENFSTPIQPFHGCPKYDEKNGSDRPVLTPGVDPLASFSLYRNHPPMEEK
jgi:hypothetical protein